jgi:hypothetical protein
MRPESSPCAGDNPSRAAGLFDRKKASSGFNQANMLFIDDAYSLSLEINVRFLSRKLPDAKFKID